MDAVELRQAWTSLLLPHPWQAILTLTFDRRISSPRHAVLPEFVDKGFRRLIQFVNERLYGKRWLRSTKHKGVIWARVDECHDDGMLHFHAVIYSPSSPMSGSLLRAIKDWWARHFGIARVETPRSREDVLQYLTKHLAFPERAELEISNNFRNSE